MRISDAVCQFVIGEKNRRGRRGLLCLRHSNNLTFRLSEWNICQNRGICSIRTVFIYMLLKSLYQSNTGKNRLKSELQDDVCHIEVYVMESHSMGHFSYPT